MYVLVIAHSINGRPLTAHWLKLSGLIMESRIDSAGNNQNAHMIISKYNEIICRLMLYHNHCITKPISYYLDPPTLPPEDLEPPPEKVVSLQYLTIQLRHEKANILHSNCTADQRLSFCCTNSTIFLLLKT